MIDEKCFFVRKIKCKLAKKISARLHLTFNTVMAQRRAVAPWKGEQFSSLVEDYSPKTNKITVKLFLLISFILQL